MPKAAAASPRQDVQPRKRPGLKRGKHRIRQAKLDFGSLQRAALSAC